MSSVYLGDFPRSISGSKSGIFQITVSTLGLGSCEILYVPFQSTVTLSYSPPAFLYIGPSGLQSQIFWRLICPVQDAWLVGAEYGAWNPSSLGRTFVIVIILLFVGYRSVGLDCFRSLPFLPILWFFLYVFSCGKPFLLVFRGFLQMIVSSSKTGVPLGSELKVFLLWHLCHTTK